MASIINLTPHSINLLDRDGNQIAEFRPEGTPARVSVRREHINPISCGGVDVPITRSVFGEVENLPEPQEGVLFITSMMVANAAKDRDDLLVTDDAVRDDAGRIIGCRAFSFPNA